MNKFIGTLDRTLRIVVGLALIALAATDTATSTAPLLDRKGEDSKRTAAPGTPPPPSKPAKQTKVIGHARVTLSAYPRWETRVRQQGLVPSMTNTIRKRGRA